MSGPADAGDARRAPVTVLGAGSWGTALAMHLVRAGRPVRLWARDPELAASAVTCTPSGSAAPGR